MKKLANMANMNYNGKFSLMKIDEYWRCCLGEIVWKIDLDEYNRQIDYMAKGETAAEAIENCIKDEVDIYKIEEKIKSD